MTIGAVCSWHGVAHPYATGVPDESTLDLAEAVQLTRTGDLWLFRGRSAADRAIQLATNAPVNHVGMTLLLDDLPPLMWHAELGRSLPDQWTGGRHRGAQLHDLADAVSRWATRYRQRVWLRQLEPPAGREEEDRALRVVARLDGLPFPSATRLAARWLGGRVPPWPKRPSAAPEGGTSPPPASGAALDGELEAAYCAEVVALTLQEMGLLPADRRPGWYDPGRFWSGDGLRLTGDWTLGGELAVQVPGAS